MVKGRACANYSADDIQYRQKYAQNVQQIDQARRGTVKSKYQRYCANQDALLLLIRYRVNNMGDQKNGKHGSRKRGK